MLKRLLILCLIALVLGIGTNVYFVLYINPDFNFFAKLADASERWEQELRHNHSHVYVLAGGSSGRAGVDPQILLDEYQIPLINATMGAGYGMDVNVALAWKHLRPKDTLILDIEPALLVGHALKTTQPMGVRMLLREQPTAFYQSPLLDLNLKTYVTPFVGDSASLASYITKRLTRPKERLYAYESETRIHPSGWMEVTTRSGWHATARLAQHIKSLDAYTLTPAAVQSYKRIQEQAAIHNVKLMSMIPRLYAHESYRVYSLWLALQLTRLGLPVIHDPTMGVVTSTDLLADTVNHLNAQGTRDNSVQLGESLQKQQFWSEQELINELQKRGFDAQGQKQPHPAS